MNSLKSVGQNTIGFFTNAGTWLVVLSVITIGYTAWKMVQLYQTMDQVKDSRWMQWTGYIVWFLLAIVALVMWGIGSLAMPRAPASKSSLFKSE